jgi:hypothetical protein
MLLNKLTHSTSRIAQHSCHKQTLPAAFCSTLSLHFALMLFLFLTGRPSQAVQSAKLASAAHVLQAALVQSSPLLWQQPFITPAIVLSGAP